MRPRLRIVAPLLAVGFAFYRWLIPALIMLAVGFVASLVEDYEYEDVEADADDTEP